MKGKGQIVIRSAKDTVLFLPMIEKLTPRSQIHWIIKAFKRRPGTEFVINVLFIPGIFFFAFAIKCISI